MGGELAEDWCIEDPNEEWYNPTGGPKGTWMPEGSVILELLERIQKEKVFELKWKCPGRRPPPSAEVEEEMEAEEEEEEEDWAEEQPADKSAGFGEFDFDDAPSEVSAKITPRRTPGAGKSPRPQKRVARMDDVLNKIMTQRRQSEAARVSKGLGVRGRRTPIYSTGSPRSRFGSSLFKQKPSPFQLHKMSSQLKSPVPSAKAGPKPPGGAMPMEVDGNVDTHPNKAPLETAQPRVHTQIPVTTTALQNVDNSSSKAEITSVMESRASVHNTTPLVAAASSAATTVTTAVSTPKSNPVPTTKHETPVEYREPIPKLLLKIPPKSTNQPATSMILPPGHSRTSHGSHAKKPPANQALGQQDSHSLKTQNQIPPEHVNQPKTPQPYARAQPQQGTPKTPPLYPGPPRTPPLYQGPPRTPPLQHKPNTPPAAHGSGPNSQLHQYTQQYAQQAPAAAHSGRPAQSGARTPPVSMHAPGIMSSLGQTERSSGSGAFMTGGQNVSHVINTGPKTPTSLSGGSKTPPFIGAPAGFSGGPKTPPFMNAPMSGGSSAKTPPVMVRSPNVPRTVSGGPKASPGIASSPLSYPPMGTGPTTSPLTSGSNASLGMPGPHMLPAFPGGPKTPPALGSGPKVHVGHGRSKTPPANMSGQRTPPAFQSGPKTPPAYAQAAKGNPFFQQQMLQSLANAHNQRSGGGNQGQPPSSSPQRLHSPQSAQWSAPSGQYPPRSAPSPSQHPPQRSVPSPGQQFSPHSIPSPSPQFSPRSLQSPLGSPRAPHGQIIQSPPRSTPHSPHSAGAPPRSPFHLNFPLPGFDQGQIRDAIQQQQQHVLQQHAIQLQKQQKQQHLQHQLQQQQHGQPSPQHQTRPKTPPAYPGTIARPQFPPSRPPPPLNTAATPPVNRPPGPRFRHETHPVSSTGQQRPLHPIPHSTQTAQPAHLNQSMSLHTSRPPLPANQHQSSGRVTDQGNGSG